MFKKGSNIILMIIYSITSILLFLDYFFGSRFYNILSYNPFRIVYFLEFYRILSFPFAVNMVESFLLLTATMILILPKLRGIYPKRTFTVFQLIMILISFLTLTIILKNAQLNYSGVELVCFYVLSQAVMFLPNKKLKVNDNFYISYQLISLVIFASWLVMRIYNYTHFTPALIKTDIISMTVALCFSDYIRIRMKYLKKLNTLENANKSRLRNAYYSEPAPAFVSTKFTKKSQKYKVKSEYFYLEDENYSDEDKLNIILDKISEKGQESLGNIELKFLQEYSEKMK